MESIFTKFSPPDAGPRGGDRGLAIVSGAEGAGLRRLGLICASALAAVALVGLAAQWKTPATPVEQPATRAGPAALTVVITPPPAAASPAAAPVIPPVAAPPTPVARAVARAKPVKAAPVRASVRREPRTEARGAGGCGVYRNEALARCLWPQVLDAESNLRRAYGQAVDEGVERSMLVFYRNRWSDLSRSARRDPQYAIVAYRDMASDLDRARIDAR